MQEIKIPEGCKASIDFEKRVVIIEKEFTPKEGDIIYCNYPDGDINVSWITLVKKVKSFEKNNTNIDTYALYVICTNDSKKDAPYLEIDSTQSADCSVRLATPSEAQQLFDALAKEGKKWNPETLQIEDIEKDILVPEGVGIYRLSDRATTSHDNGDGLYISFNEYKQVLFYSDGQYGVINLDNICLTKSQCKLTPCKREDLKAGDTFLMKEILQDVEDILYNPSEYIKSMTARANEFAWIDEGTDVVLSKMDDSHKQLYKVEPIN